MALDIPADLRGIDLFLYLHNRMREIFVAKNTDYAGATHREHDPWANFRFAERIGVPAYLGAWVRKIDKETRAKNIHLHGNAVQDEGLVDTLFDDAVYALIVLCAYVEHLRDGGTRGSDMDLAYARHGEIVDRIVDGIARNIFGDLANIQGIEFANKPAEEMLDEWRDIVARAILAPPDRDLLR